MRCLLTILLLAMFSSTAEPAEANFSLATGVELVSSVKQPGEKAGRLLEFKETQQYLLVAINDFFYSREPFEPPFLTVGKNGTLTLCTKKKKGLFNANEEYLRSVDVKINRSRLAPNQIIYVLNGDTGEVLGHYIVKMK